MIFDPEANGKRCVSVNTWIHPSFADFALRGNKYLGSKTVPMAQNVLSLNSKSRLNKTWNSLISGVISLFVAPQRSSGGGSARRKCKNMVSWGRDLASGRSCREWSVVTDDGARYCSGAMGATLEL